MDNEPQSSCRISSSSQVSRKFSRMDNVVDSSSNNDDNNNKNSNNSDEKTPSPHAAPRKAKSWGADSKPSSLQHDIMDSDSRPTSSMSAKMPTVDESSVSSQADVFETNHQLDSDSEEEEGGDVPEEQQRHGDTLASDDVPINILSLTDRFLNSLKAKTYSSPPTIEALSALFQNFYIRASEEIRGERPPQATNPLRTVRSFSLLRPNSRQRSHSPPESTESTEHQMLTPEEVARRRKSRKAREQKNRSLEEAVERIVCESVYDKTWCHRSSLDEVRDEKLRSKTAALSLVGITLKELGIPILLSGTEEGTTEKNEEIRRELETARDDLLKMNEKRYPLGKLQHLIAAHRSIVSTLTKALPSNSSADEILPTLIYTLITSPTEGISIIANLLYIQRFRMSSKLNGEAAYCMANLEAAISFLENVDLSSLRKGENITSTPSFMTNQSTTKTSSSLTSADRKALALPKSQTGNESPQRRFSELFQPPVKALEAANDAMRSTADQGLKNLSNSFDNLNNVVFGRFREMQTSSPEADADAVAPKTLDDARKLVSDPVADSPTDVDGKNNGSPSSSAKDGPELSATQEHSRNRSASKVENSFMGLISGRSTQRSNSIGAKEQQQQQRPSITSAPNEDAPALSSYTAGSLSKFNPLSHIPEIMIRGFSRSATEPSVETIEEAADNSSGEPLNKAESEDTQRTDPRNLKPSEITPAATATTPFPPLRNIEPPIQRFIDLDDASDLKLNEVSTLLNDYKRIASALDDLLTGP